MGELAAAAAKQPVPTLIALKEKTDWKILGSALPRLDTPAKVDGSAGFGTDVVVANMLVATIQAAPVFTARLKSVDPAPALKVQGVIPGDRAGPRHEVGARGPRVRFAGERQKHLLHDVLGIGKTRFHREDIGEDRRVMPDIERLHLQRALLGSWGG